jgi:uncharacterized protein (TIGR03382 family)
MLGVRAGGVAVALILSAGASGEVITVRSGQVGGLPGLAGQSDDIVRYLPNNPPGAMISANPFTAADFLGAVTGPSALVIDPVGPWTPGISDPSARWINFGMLPGSTYGAPGSSLYAVPFVVTTAGITNATISLEYAVDDYLGDALYGGPNPDGLYINGVPTGYSGGSYATPTFYGGNITAMVNTGINYLYFYQRDQGVSVSGLIFSATIEVIPAPGTAGLLGLGAIVGLRRRR